MAGVGSLVWHGPYPLYGSAAPTLSGYEGGIEFPGWSVAPLNSLRVSWTWIGGEASSLFPPHPNRYYAATVVLLPGLELNARFTEAIGVPDSSITLPNYVDRMVSLKWAPELPKDWPRVAIGALDALSINELNSLSGMVPGSSSYGRGVYGVVGSNWAGSAMTAGLLVRNASQVLPFAHAGIPIGFGLETRMEGSSKGISLGLSWNGPGGLHLLLARVAGRDWAFGLSWDVTL